MTAGLRFAVCLQEAGSNQARRVPQAVFPPSVSTFIEGMLQIKEGLSQCLCQRDAMERRENKGANE